MASTTWIKPALFGAVIGAICVTVIGFSTDFWVTTSKAEVMANEQSDAAVSQVLLPICVELASRDSDRGDKIEAIRAKPSYQRNEAIMNAGWTTMPGAEQGDRRVASACVASLLN